MNKNEAKKFKGGYMGKYLVVDLTTRSYEVKSLDPEFAKKYVGGRGFTARIEFDELKHIGDPLGPENVLIFAPGPLTGTGYIGGNRITVGGKSPLTGILGDSSVGGWFPIRLKQAGYDYLLIRGKSDTPVFLWINDDKVEFVDASGYWGKDTYTTSEFLYDTFGKDASALLVGQGGEHGVRFACVISIEYGGAPRAAGRTGMGAVMGSKNLKAVIVRGTHKIPVADREKLKEVIKQTRKIILEDPQYRLYSDYGTTRFISVLNTVGCLATRNRQDLVFEHADKIDGKALRDQYFVKNEKCPYCFVNCGVVAQIPSGDFATREVKMEFFPLASLGSNVGNSNLESIVKAKELCDAYGMDIAESGAVIGFAMECYQRGLITKEETDGMDLSWDNSPELVPVLLEKIAMREGYGDRLAEGVYRYSKHVGKGCDHFALQIKGMSMEVMDARMMQVYNSRQRIASRGADHLRGQGVGGDILATQPVPQAMKGLIRNETHCGLSSMLGICNFPDILWSSTREITDEKAINGRMAALSAVFGENVSWDDFAKNAERITTLERAVIVREGITKKDDELPKRLLEDPVPSGPTKGQVCTISDEFIEQYYTLRGWDLETGIPTEEKLLEMGLEDVAADLKALGKLA
ncbi:MAG: aldehyde ferredoxin oxidoreductase family protein [Theionarchaea archaeon]|nr:aldehyde ferredoxin oxidoreductase family protein [Theionarchaea archaeon]